MVSLSQLVSAKYPTAVPGVNFVVIDDGKQPEYIAKWDAGVLGKQPSADELATFVPVVESKEKEIARKTEYQTQVTLAETIDMLAALIPLVPGSDKTDVVQAWLKKVKDIQAAKPVDAAVP